MQTWIAKVPEVTLVFWIVKILCTSVGEIGADALTMSYFGETTENVSPVLASIRLPRRGRVFSS